MMRSCLRSSVLLWLLAAPAASAADWPHARGPAFNGAVPAPGTFEAVEVSLDLAWRVPVGSGYSGIAVAGGRAVTMFAEDDGDWIAAFDAGSGKQLWRVRVGDVHKGQDGADDGPLSSPVIGGGRVYALGPRGNLIALQLKNGKMVWSRQLDREFESEPPHFGYTTTPLYADGLLLVLPGGKNGNSIVGLDAKSGQTRWSYGDDGISYQSPAVMELAGVRQVVAVSAGKISGLALENGELLWEHAFAEGERASSTTPTFVGDDRFLILMSGGAGVFRVSRAGESHTVAELYRSQALGQTYAHPVYHDGHVYGFRGQVLTCMNAADGERVWRSRPPGGDGLIVVDGHLVIFGAKGNIVIAEANPEGYNERARLQALEGSSLTWPSFADGRVYIRNLSEMASVNIGQGAGGGTVSARLQGDHEFGRWIARLERSTDRQALVDAFFAEHPQTPIVEGEYVHFVFRGDAGDVSVHGTMLENETPESLKRVEGTDLFHRTYRLEPGSRWEYRYQVDFEDWTPDPLNPHRVPDVDGDGERSELLTPGYREADHLDEPEGPRGREDGFTLASEVLGYEKEIKVWLPPGYDDGRTAYPLLVVSDGEAWLSKGLLSKALDNLVGTAVEPVIVAFVPPARQWWTEAGGTRTEDYVKMLAEELVPAMAARYRLTDSPSSHGLLGNRFYAFSSAYAALQYPEVFGKVAVQSVYTGLGKGDELEQMIRARQGAKVRFYVDWNRYDERNVDREWDLAADTRQLATLLEQSGYSLSGGEVLDSAGWGGWRRRTDEMLTALFPKKR